MALHSVQGTGGDYVSLNPGTSYNALLNYVGEHWTIAGWFRLTDSPLNNSYLLSYGNYSANDSANVYFGSGELRLRWTDSVSGDMRMESGAPAWPDYIGAWQHFALRRDGSTFRAYRNGVQTQEQTFALGDIVRTASNLHFGTRNGDAAVRRVDVDFAEWAKWDKTLTTHEISLLGKGRSPLWFPHKRSWYAPMRTFGRDYDNRLAIPRNGVATVVADPPGIVHPSRPVIGFVAAAPGAGRIMASLANHGGLAGPGGIAGQGGGLAA